MFSQRISNYFEVTFSLLYHKLYLLRRSEPKTVFTSIWKNNIWGSNETISGPGSTLDQAQNLIDNFPSLIEKFGIQTVFDAPCGDFHWMKEIIRNCSFTYIGGDIVDEIININSKKYSTADINFRSFDITNDSFPKADLWLCRAIFYHLPNYQIYLALKNFMNSNIDYILTTNSVTTSGHKNLDILAGDWRPLNLQLPPFNFPQENSWEIDDYAPPHPPTKLVLWHKRQILEAFESMKLNFGNK